MKQSGRRHIRRSRRTSSGRHHFWIWALLFFLLAAAASYFWVQEKNISQKGTGLSAAEEKAESDEEQRGDYSRLSAAAAECVKTWIESNGGTAAVTGQSDKTGRVSSGQAITWKHTDMKGLFRQMLDRESLVQFLHSQTGKRWSAADGDPGQKSGQAVQQWDLVMQEDTKDGEVSLHMITLSVQKASAGPGEEAGTAEKSGTDSHHPVRGRLAVCIDDSGYDLETQKIYEDMGIPLTLSVMPNQRYTAQSAAEGKAAGLEIILHQPMESISETAMEKTTILTSMDDSEIQSVLDDSLSQVPQAIGMNNHQGSKATADRRVMQTVMADLKRRGLFFFDSRTSSRSVGAQEAARAGIGTVSNELFIDNSTDESSIRARIREAADIAVRDGSAVVIGHCRPHTARALWDMLPELQNEGIQFVFLSSLLR